MKKKLFIILLCIYVGRLAHAQNIKDTEGERSITVEQKIGSTDYREFGKLEIAKRSAKYYLTFPVFQYLDEVYYYPTAADTMPAGSPIYLLLKNGKVVQSKTEANTDFKLHYLWRYSKVSNSGAARPEGYPTGFSLYTWHSYDKTPDLKDVDNYYNLGGTSWLMTFEFTHADMEALSGSCIVKMHTRKGSQIIFIPIKKWQAKKVRKSIARLL